MNLYVSNLSLETTERDLEQAFSEFGSIKSLKIIIDRETGMSKGYGFVEYEEKGSGFDAIDNIDMAYLKGNIVNVREAKNNKTGGAPTNPRDKKPFQKKPYQQRSGGGNYQSRDGQSRNSTYNKEPNFNRESNFNRDTNFNNDLSYNA